MFNDEVMEKMKNTYKNLLELSKCACPVPLSELPTMPRYLSIPPRGSPDEFIAVHEMFHVHAINNPDRIALSCAETNQAMTYGKLDDASASRAHGT